MASKIHKIPFKGFGLNSDDSEEYFPLGDSKERRNVIPASDDGGRLEHSLGNSKIDSEYTPYYTITESKVLGYATDHENDKIYYFLQGKTAGANLNSIIEFDPLGDDDATAYIQVLWEQSALEFEEDRIIKGAEVIDGWIYYNGYSYGLKKVNITFGKNFTDYDAWVSEDTYVIGNIVRVRDGRTYIAITNHDSETGDPRNDDTNWSEHTLYTYPCDSSGNLEALSLNRMHVPPVSPITFAYGSDTAKEINNLRGKLFQFTYRYKYREHGYSRTANVSTITLPEDDESIEGEIVNDITANNYLDLAFQSGDLGVIEWVELFIREGNFGTWFYVKRFEEGESTYTFYNDIALEAMDDNEVNTMADSLPRESNAERYISENVMLSAGNTEGFNNIELDVTMTAGFEESVLTGAGALRGSFTITESVVDEGLGGERLYGKFNVDALPGGTAAGDYVEIYAQSANPSYTVSTSFVADAAAVASAAAFSSRCITEIINAAAPDMEADANDHGFVNFDNGDFSVSVVDEGDTSWGANYIKISAPATGEVKKWSGFKTGAIHKFGIQYYDEEMRPFAVMTSDDTEIYIPTIPEGNGVGSDLDDEYKWRSYVDWVIGHTPPTGAAYWQWAYAGNSNISNFWTYVLDKDLGVEDTDDTYGVAAAGTAYTCFDIGPLIDVSGTFPLSQVSYTWEAGDRVRVITLPSTVNDTYGDLVAFGNISDIEIVTYDDATNRLVLPYDTTTNKYFAGGSSLIEIYRPKATTEETIYYVCGPVYETYTDGGVLYHKGSTQNQDVGNDAEGTLVRGDVYFIARAFSQELAGAGGSSPASVYLVETPSYSDFYTSNSYNYGKINVESDLGETYLNDIRWTNTFVQDTYINGLCTYDALDYISLPNRNGQIQAIEQIGDMLRVYQEDRTTAVWIGKTEYIDTTGQSTVSKTDSVLGSTRELSREFGTLNPESIVKIDNYVYGYDIQNGVFWRDSVNGLFPISGRETETGQDYKMEHYFRNISKTLLESGVSDVNMLTEWDGEYKLLYVTFKDANTPANNETLAFHEPSNRWYSFYDIWVDAETDLFIDCYARYKNYFYSFLEGELYKMNDPDADRATFFTVKYDVIVDVVFNPDPSLSKTLEAIGLHTAGNWTVSEVNIEADTSNTNGMYSEISSTYFNDIEGVQRAPFLRNMKTRSAVNDNWDLHNGDRLRGRTAQIVLKNTSTSEVKLVLVEIIYEDSII